MATTLTTPEAVNGAWKCPTCGGVGRNACVCPTPERLHPTDDLCLVADDLADRVADLARAVKAAEVPMLGVIAALDAAHADLVRVSNAVAAATVRP